MVSMTKASSAVLAVFLIASLQPFFADAAGPDPAGPEKSCEPELRRIKALEDDREKMVHEIRRLHDENRRLEEILDRIRSQIGNGWPAPNSHEPPHMQ